MLSARDRYRSDAAYKNLVDMLHHQIRTHQFTPAEVREAAVLASIDYEMTTIRQFHIPLTAELHERLKELDVMISEAREGE